MMNCGSHPALGHNAVHLRTRANRCRETRRSAVRFAFTAMTAGTGAVLVYVDVRADDEGMPGWESEALPSSKRSQSPVVYFDSCCRARRRNSGSRAGFRCWVSADEIDRAMHGPPWSAGRGGGNQNGDTQVLIPPERRIKRCRRPITPGPKVASLGRSDPDCICDDLLLPCCVFGKLQVLAIMMTRMCMIRSASSGTVSTRRCYGGRTGPTLGHVDPLLALV